MSPASYQTAPPRNVWNSVFGFQCCDACYEHALYRDVSFLPPESGNRCNRGSDVVKEAVFRCDGTCGAVTDDDAI